MWVCLLTVNIHSIIGAQVLHVSRWSIIDIVVTEVAYLYARHSIPATETSDAMYLYVLVVMAAISCLRTSLFDAISSRHSGNSARLQDNGTLHGTM